MKFPNQLETGRVDFKSLEIIDPFNRPFRLKKPETKEYLVLKNKLDKEQFELRSSNSLKEFKISVGSLDHSSISRQANKILNLSDFSLHKLIIERLFFFNQSMDRIYNRLALPMKKNVLDDQAVSRDFWMPFILYTFVFQYLFKSTKKLEYLEVFPRYSGLVYRLIAFTAAQVVNKTMRRMKPLRYLFKGRVDGKFMVHNLWTRLKINETISPFLPFIERPRFAKLFKTYESNELGDRQYFNQMSRIKIMVHYLKSAVNISELRDKKLLKNFFCLHDRYSKDWKSNYLLFEDVIENFEEEIQLKQSKNKEDRRIKHFMSNMQNYGDPSDFLEQSLKADMKYHCCDPMYIEISPIRDYFGEKVALMFSFISYYGKKKYFIVWVTTLVYVLLSFTPLKDTIAYKYIQFVQMVLINLYSLNFYQRWGQREKLFAMRFGQNGIEEEPESRVRFKGFYVRNLATNSMNQRRVNKKRRTAIFLINLMLLGISITASFASTQIKTFIELFFKSQNVGQSSSGHTTLQYCLVVMNALIVELLNILYDQIYIKMTDYENYSDLQEYETSLILKRFTFKLINMFNSMVIIALFKSAFPLIFGVCTDFGLSAKGSTYCFIELRVQVIIFFLFSTLMELVREIWLILKIKLRKRRKKWKVKKRYPFARIDKKIHSQAIKPNYETTNQIDGTSKDIMKYIIEYGYLSMLGFSAPIIFIFSLISNIIFLALAKYKMLYLYKRPIPLSAKSMSPFSSIINFIGTFSIVTNSIVFGITLMGFDFEHIASIQANLENYYDLGEAEQAAATKAYNAQMNTNFISFIVVFIVLMLIKFVFNSIFGDFAEKFQKLAERHQQIKFKIFAMTGKTNLLFARAGMPTNVPESFEDQVNMLNKQYVWKGQPGQKNQAIQPSQMTNQTQGTESSQGHNPVFGQGGGVEEDTDVTGDVYFKEKGVSKEQYYRMVELLVEGSMKADESFKKDKEEIRRMETSQAPFPRE